MQLARLESARGNFDTAIRAFRDIRTEAKRLGEKHSQMEASVYLSEIGTRLGDAIGTLELLAGAEAEAGDDAELYACALARARAGALAFLGRTAEACSEVESGLTIARAEGLQYEEALLLVTRSRLGDACEGGREVSIREAEILFRKLGVVTEAPAETVSVS